MFTMRFDMRTPASGAPTPELYDAALEMCAWGETRGAIMAVLSEHHATADGHLPSPLMLASAIAARTTLLNILVAAAVLPLYHPVRLAEDMAVLDNLSKGRVHYVFGIGHRPEEYEHMGVDARRRGKIADESLQLFLELLAGDPVDLDGRRIHVTPAPATRGGPRIMIAGGSTAAAKRAGRHGLGFIAFTDAPELKRLRGGIAGTRTRAGTCAVSRRPQPHSGIRRRRHGRCMGRDRLVPSARRPHGRSLSAG